MLRILGGFAASMAVVIAAVLLLLSIGTGDRWQVPIDARDGTVSASPDVWPAHAGLSLTPADSSGGGGPVIMPPPDPAARAKFPGENPGVVDGLALLNKVVNQVIKPMDDQAHYGVPEQMVSWPPDLKGDCEDYALSKLVTLVNSKVGVVEYTRLRFVYATAPDGQLYGHVVLEVRMPRGAVAFLDNNFDPLMTRAELEARGYHFFDW